jgi:RNA polymerase sigma factor (sigma-70 family)
MNEKEPNMESASHLKTNLSFLARLGSWQDEAWSKFLTDYRPVMVHWAERYTHSPADAEEVADRVLLNLVRRMPSFEHDGRERGFRNYLSVAIRNAARNFVDERVKIPGALGAGDSAVTALINEAADSASVVQLDEKLGEGKIKVQIEKVFDAVKAVLRSPTTWRAFELHVLEGRTARDVAAELSIPIGDVYVHASRVRARLRKLESCSPLAYQHQE